MPTAVKVTRAQILVERTQPLQPGIKQRVAVDAAATGGLGQAPHRLGQLVRVVALGPVDVDADAHDRGAQVLTLETRLSEHAGDLEQPSAVDGDDVVGPLEREPVSGGTEQRGGRSEHGDRGDGREAPGMGGLEVRGAEADRRQQ